MRPMFAFYRMPNDLTCWRIFPRELVDRSAVDNSGLLNSKLFIELSLLVLAPFLPQGLPGVRRFLEQRFSLPESSRT